MFPCTRGSRAHKSVVLRKATALLQAVKNVATAHNYNNTHILACFNTKMLPLTDRSL